MEILKKNNVTTIVKDEGRPFRILQLTDIHYGAGWLSAKRDKKALEAVDGVVLADVSLENKEAKITLSKDVAKQIVEYRPSLRQ